MFFQRLQKAEVCLYIRSSEALQKYTSFYSKARIMKQWGLQFFMLLHRVGCEIQGLVFKGFSFGSWAEGLREGLGMRIAQLGPPETYIVLRVPVPLYIGILSPRY